MKTVGEILKNQRQKQQLTLEEIARKTRIQEKYLDALEKNDFKHLPTHTFVKGFIQNYALAIGLDAKTALAIFRRDFIEDEKGHIIPRSLLSPIEQKLIISPKITRIIALSSITLLIIGIFVRQIILFYKGPEITITTPQESQEVVSPIVISGSAKNAVEVTLNNQPVQVGLEGDFSREIQLSAGDHIITLTAVSRDGKTKTVQRHIIVSP